MTLSATSSKAQLLNSSIFFAGLLGFLIAAVLRNNDLGLVVSFLAVILNLGFVSRRHRVDLIKAITCFSLGFFFEYLNMNLRTFYYEFTPTIPPVWMLGLWPLISTLFFSAFKDLSSQARWKIFACGLPICGVHIFMSHFGRIEFLEPKALTYGITALIIALEFSVVAFICKKLDARPEISRPKA
ncbi:MAG: DUF2878 domain-containing protein [Bdellovibrionales bacterium]|nr:DUF2878 domain-containing protein [Bdellovibrionales bacterium]